MRINTSANSPKLTTFEGAISKKISNTQALERAVLSTFLYEDTFYEKGSEVVNRIKELIPKVPFSFLEKLCVRCRKEMHNRRMPLFLIACAFKYHTGTRALGDLIVNTVDRPDEMAELIAIFKKLNPNTRTIPNQMKIGIARAMKNFKEYSMVKWRTPHSPFKLEDAVFLCHPRFNEEQAESARLIANLVNKDFFPEFTKSSHAPIKAMFEADAIPQIPEIETWERRLSSGENKKTVFSELLKEGKLGEMAFLRNLRNMKEAGISDADIIAGSKLVSVRKALPFRFIAAAKHAPTLNSMLEEMMFQGLKHIENFEGKTAVLIDASSSMNNQLSSKSEMTRNDAACALAILFKEKAPQTRVFAFSSDCVEIPTNRTGFAIKDAVIAYTKPEWTLLGKAVKHILEVFPDVERIVIITDEQSIDSPPNLEKDKKGYIINVSAHQQGIAHGNWETINGWSDEVVSYIQCLENPLAV